MVEFGDDDSSASHESSWEIFVVNNEGGNRTIGLSMESETGSTWTLAATISSGSDGSYVAQFKDQDRWFSDRDYKIVDINDGPVLDVNVVEAFYVRDGPFGAAQRRRGAATTTRAPRWDGTSPFQVPDESELDGPVGLEYAAPRPTKTPVTFSP